jgi:deoxyhypusine synthase
MTQTLPTFISGQDLRKKGLNRIGNLVVPNDNYCKFEDWVTPILDSMLEEQKAKVILIPFRPLSSLRSLGM